MTGTSWPGLWWADGCRQTGTKQPGMKIIGSKNETGRTCLGVLTIKTNLDRDNIGSMRPRLVTPMDEVPMIGGRLCLDFVNTTGHRAGIKPRERLHSYRDLLTFGCRKGVLTDPESADLLAAAQANPWAASRVVRGMISLREFLHGLFLAVANGQAPTKANLNRLNHLQARSYGQRRLTWAAHNLDWKLPDWSLDLESLSSRVVISAVELLTSQDINLVRKCGECDWLFVDQSKNHSRRWCKKTCGDRVKARRYYARRAAQA